MRYILANYKIIFTFFLIAVFYRLLIAKFFPQPFIFDQSEYHQVALDILGDHQYMFIGRYRLYGYPLILAVIYFFFGFQSSFPWILIQSGLDAIVAIIVFVLSQKLFGRNSIAWISFVLYILNPFTSTYAGVRLTETSTIFITALIFLLLLIFSEKKKIRYASILSFLLGLLPQIRPGFLYYSLFLLIVMLFQVVYMREKGKKLTKSFLILILFFIPFTYNLVRNYVYYKQISFMTADNLFVREFYISLYTDSEERLAYIPKEVSALYQEYSKAEDNTIMAKKYWNLAMQKIMGDPKSFVVTRFAKMFYVWEKHTPFHYLRIDNLFVALAIYWGNLILVLSSVAGYLLWERKRKEIYKIFSNALVALFIYITVIHAFTITSERFSLPAYPFIIMFSLYFFIEFLKKLRFLDIKER